MAEEVEETLDKDFLLFVSLTKTYYSQIADDKDKTLCMQWLMKLCGERVEGISQKRNRNIFLSYLIMNMQEGKMTGPFSKPPGNNPLPPAKIIFGLQKPDEVNVAQQADDIEMSADFQETSADGRTYVAVRSLPNDQGTYAFVALSLDKEKSNAADVTIIPCAMDKSKLRHAKVLHKLSASTILGDRPSESQMEDFYIRNIEAKVSGDLTELYKSLHTPRGRTCGRHKEEVAFYDVLLKQIDEAIKGTTSEDNGLVKFLVSRLAQDLENVPRMKHLFKLTPEQQNLKLLEILRQKLVVRQQEEKHRNLLAEMEERMLASSLDSKCCMDRSDEPTEFMWQLTVTKPLPEMDLEKLYNVYPEEAIATFLDLLAEERQMILERGRKRQQNLIESMRSEVYKEVQSGKAEYDKCRTAYREWSDILSTVEEMLYEAGNETVENDQVPEQKEAMLMNMVADIKETENLVVEEARRGEMLTEKIINANMWTFSIQEDNGEDHSWEIKSTIDSLRKQIEAYGILVNKQKQRIKQLREQLDYT